MKNNIFLLLHSLLYVSLTRMRTPDSCSFNESLRISDFVLITHLGRIDPRKFFRVLRWRTRHSCFSLSRFLNFIILRSAASETPPTQSLPRRRHRSHIKIDTFTCTSASIRLQDNGKWNKITLSLWSTLSWMEFFARRWQKFWEQIFEHFHSTLIPLLSCLYLSS